MARSFVSPGVFTKETDASFLAPGVGAIGAALIGTAPMGPAFIPVPVGDYSQFVEFFGDLDSDHLLGYAARAYLRNSSQANIVRVLGPTGRNVNGVAVEAGYSAESVWGITAVTGSSTAALMALLEITASADLVINDLGDHQFDIRIADHDSNPFDPAVSVTASFLTASSNYIKKVLNTDPTKFSTAGYYVRDVYDYAFKATKDGNAIYTSASYAMTDFTEGYMSASSPWIKSQLFGGATEYNLFRVHTLGHGEAENGRFKVSVSNIRQAVAPEVSDFGRFDLEVRTFGDTDASKNVVETFPNLTLDPQDPNYLLRVVGDKLLLWDNARDKMVEYGSYENLSKLIRIELTTGSFPDSALPWGFRGLAKPDLGFSHDGLTGSGGTEVDGFDSQSTIQALPYVADLLDKKNQAEADSGIYWGMETQLSGNVSSRFTLYPVLTGSDADFSLSLVSGSTLSNVSYNATNPSDNYKAPGDTTADTVLQPSHAKFTVPLAFGFDGFDRRLTDPLNNETQLAAVSSLGTQAVRQAIDVIADPDFIDINMLLTPGLHSSKVVEYGITKVQDRADTFYPFDVSGSTVTAVVQEVKNRGFDTNYASTYYPSFKVFDDVNGGSKVLPASIAAAGTIAFNDRVSAPWFAPAGLNRAGLSRDTVGFDVLAIEDRLTREERDSLYENRINPIAQFPGNIKAVWGQKTLQLKASALDRINVRRLLIRAKKLVASATRYLVFEPNNAATQTRFRQLINPILQEIKIKQGLETFKVVFDASTNPPELIDRNIMAGKIFLVPTRTAEFISVDFVISKSGASFDE